MEARSPNPGVSYGVEVTWLTSSRGAPSSPAQWGCAKDCRPHRAREPGVAPSCTLHRRNNHHRAHRLRAVLGSAGGPGSWPFSFGRVRVLRQCCGDRQLDTVLGAVGQWWQGWTRMPARAVVRLEQQLVAKRRKVTKTKQSPGQQFLTGALRCARGGS